MADTAAFCRAFRDLTGSDPFPWQSELYLRFVSGNLPDRCDIPTGLGKTSVVAIWLIALANLPEIVPRRLLYVVNRRTVVDQTAYEVEKLRHNLRAAGLHEQLTQLCAVQIEKQRKDDIPLAISTLRGQYADNREWSADPCRSAVIAGTVDMIGSRLLFSGYGIGFKMKPLHAGFLGQDALLVHDEAHLEPAFQRLIEDVKREQHEGERTGPLPWPKLRVMALSATSRAGGEVLGLSDADRANAEVRKRIEAKKAISLHKLDDESKLADEIANLAQGEHMRDRAVLVFVRKVDDVEKLVKQLPKGATQQITGTLRGLERDRMADPRKERGCPIFARFLKPPKADADESDRWKIEPKTGTVFLVCTSAGEVGVNISADHMVCDLSTFESMAQRFGRVNRFGDRPDTRIEIVYPADLPSEEVLSAERAKEKSKQDPSIFVDGARRRTLELLSSLNGDGSPKALGNLDANARLAAFAPPPDFLLVSDILFDSWALTTIRGKLPGRPPVEPYLHGISGWEPPETHVAWREEVGVITGELSDQYKPGDLLEDFPLKPHELLRDRSDRVFKHLTALAQRRPDYPAWLLDDEGDVEASTLAELADKDRKDRINYRTILLPPTAGGLLIEKGESRGMLSGSSPYDLEHSRCYDVADEWRDDTGQQRRTRVWDNDEPPKAMRLIRTVDTKPELDDEEDEGGERRFWYWYERPDSADSDGSKAAQRPVTWQVHTNDVTTNVEQIVKNLPLSDELKQAAVLSARYHDLGKRRVLWQRSIGNPTPTNWLAKSGGKMKPREITDYRHEFGSLFDVQNEPEFQKLSDDMKEVVLHLIAVHHGFGRPHFPPDKAIDPEPKGMNVEAIAAEIPRRFARLQRKYGRWGLAYLESLLRSADYAASAKPSAFVEENK